jgi:hypothetical protein
LEKKKRKKTIKFQQTDKKCIALLSELCTSGMSWFGLAKWLWPKIFA